MKTYLHRLSALAAAAAIALLCAAALPPKGTLPLAQITASAETEGFYEYTTLSDGSAEITNYTGSESSISIPASLGGKTVTSIGSRAFYLNSYASSITIPGTVTNIGDRAFYGCRAAAVNMPANLVTLGEYAFGYCRYLASVTLPKGVTVINSSTFYHCDALSSVKINGSVTSVGESAFRECASLKSITLPASVKTIGNNAFYMSGLTSFTLPSGTESVGDYCFAFCTSLKSVSVPAATKLIGSRVFFGDTALEKITVASGNAYYCDIDGILYNKNVTELKVCPASKVSVNVPSGVKIISSYAFTDCHSLTSITLPDTVTSIGSYAFEGCSSLTSITIPKSVTTLGTNSVGFVYDSSTYSYVKTSGFVIYCEKGSAADTYAGKNDITCVYVTFRKAGDVNGDGTINMKDLTLLQQYLAAWGVDIVKTNADLDGKSGITMGDLTRLQQYLAKWDVELV